MLTITVSKIYPASSDSKKDPLVFCTMQCHPIMLRYYIWNWWIIRLRPRNDFKVDDTQSAKVFTGTNSVENTKSAHSHEKSVYNNSSVSYTKGHVY